jgi:hypothetical protein
MLLKLHVLFVQVDCLAQVGEIWIVTDKAITVICDKGCAKMQVFTVQTWKCEAVFVCCKHLA